MSTNGAGTQTSSIPRIRPGRERRKYPRHGDGDLDIVDQSLASTTDQLAEARESLKAARRRVVQLEDAVGFWQHVRRRLVDDDGSGGRRAPRAS